MGLISQNRILLVKRGKDPSKGLYAFPGGRVEPGESPKQAACREIEEETGLVAGNIEFMETLDLGKADNDPAASAYRLHVFYGIHPGGKPVAADDADEAGWFTLDEVEALPVTPSSLRLAQQLLKRIS